MMRIGLDVGSTTLKCVVLNEQNEVLFKNMSVIFRASWRNPLRCCVKWQSSFRKKRCF